MKPGSILQCSLSDISTSKPRLIRGRRRNLDRYGVPGEEVQHRKKVFDNRKRHRKGTKWSSSGLNRDPLVGGMAGSLGLSPEARLRTTDPLFPLAPSSRELNQMRDLFWPSFGGIMIILQSWSSRVQSLDHLVQKAAVEADRMTRGTACCVHDHNLGPQLVLDPVCSSDGWNFGNMKRTSVPHAGGVGTGLCTTIC